MFRPAVGTARRVVAEARQLFGLAETWPERLSVARFIAKLYAVRLLPITASGGETRVRLRGASYVVGVRTSEIYVVGEIYQARLYDQVDAFVPADGWTVFDVGANVGFFTVLQARRGAAVYAFEPNPACYRRLVRTVAANRLGGRVRAFNTALGDAPGAATLHVAGGGTTGGYVVPSGAGVAEGAPLVQVTTLDQVMSSLAIRRIDLLKIDVEGGEVAVLRGAERALAGVERVVVEYHSRELLAHVEALLARSGLFRRAVALYYPEGAPGQEVGVLYASRQR